MFAFLTKFGGDTDAGATLEQSECQAESRVSNPRMRRGLLGAGCFDPAPHRSPRVSTLRGRRPQASRYTCLYPARTAGIHTVQGYDSNHAPCSLCAETRTIFKPPSAPITAMLSTTQRLPRLSGKTDLQTSPPIGHSQSRRPSATLVFWPVLAKSLSVPGTLYLLFYPELLAI